MPALLLLFITGFPAFAQLPKSTSWEVKPVFPLVRKVVYLNDRFIAGGSDGEVMQSPDGEAWSGSFTGNRAVVSDFSFADGKYYAVQQQDLLVSTNLIDWQRF